MSSFARIGSVVLVVAAQSAAVADPPRDAQPAPAQAQRAVLVVRVNDFAGRDRPGRSLEIVHPRHGGPLPFESVRSGGEIAYADDGSPILGPGYRLVRTYRPVQHVPYLRDYVYDVDFANSTTVRIWREYQQAQRAEERMARAEERLEEGWNRRNEQLRTAHEQAVDEGLARLRAGDYRGAIIALTRAAELNQGDPACRIYLALARVAVGHDVEAARVLRRALELQAQLVPTMLNLSQHYPAPEDFAAHTAALVERTNRLAAPPPDLFLLIGFMQFQQGELDQAHVAFQRAARGRTNDRVLTLYLDLTQPVASTPPVDASATRPKAEHRPQNGDARKPLSRR